MPRGALAAAAAVALAFAGCGSSAHLSGEQAAIYSVDLPEHSFPVHQQLAAPVELRLAVRNAGSRPIPDVAATIEMGGGADGTAVAAFGSNLSDPQLSSHSRPVWIVDAGPSDGDTAYANTWTLGPVAPGRTRVFVWRVVPVRSGSYTVRYKLTGSLTGRSQLRLADGSAPHGSFTVHVSGKAATVRVTPDGRIESVPQ